MENNDVFKCSHYGCGNSFIRKNIPLDVKSPINDEDKLELMIDGIQKYQLNIIGLFNEKKV